MYRLYDEDDVGEIKTITLLLRMKIIFYQYAENIEMISHEDAQGNKYYDATSPIYENNMDEGQIVIAYKWIDEVMKILSRRYEFKLDTSIYSLIFDLFFQVIDEYALENKQHRFQIAICSAIFSAIKFYHWTDVNLKELIDIEEISSREEELESYNAYLNFYIRDFLCIIG